MDPCNAEADWCICKLPVGHESPHECTEPTVEGNPCGGQWEDRDGTFKVIRFPGLLDDGYMFL